MAMKNERVFSEPIASKAQSVEIPILRRELSVCIMAADELERLLPKKTRDKKGRLVSKRVSDSEIYELAVRINCIKLILKRVKSRNDE